MTTPEITRGEHAKLRRLHYDRERVLDLGWLHGGTPVSSAQEDYEDFLEYRKQKAQPASQPTPPVPMFVFMVPTPSPPFVPPDMSQLLLQQFSKMQPNLWPTNQTFPSIQGYDCVPTNLGHESGQAGSPENTQRTIEPAMISAVKAPPRVIEELPEPEPSKPDNKAPTKEKEKQSPEPKSIKIFHPILESFCDITVELDRCSPLNWISRGLLDKSGIDITPAKYVSHDASHGTRLESSYRAKVNWKVSSHSRTMQHDFRVHDIDSTAPNIIIGKPILELYGEDYFPNRTYSRSQKDRLDSNDQQRLFGSDRDRLVKNISFRRPQAVKRIG